MSGHEERHRHLNDVHVGPSSEPMAVGITIALVGALAAALEDGAEEGTADDTALDVGTMVDVASEVPEVAEEAGSVDVGDAGEVDSIEAGGDVDADETGEDSTPVEEEDMGDGGSKDVDVDDVTEVEGAADVDATCVELAAEGFSVEEVVARGAPDEEDEVGVSERASLDDELASVLALAEAATEVIGWVSEEEEDAGEAALEDETKDEEEAAGLACAVEGVIQHVWGAGKDDRNVQTLCTDMRLERKRQKSKRETYHLKKRRPRA